MHVDTHPDQVLPHLPDDVQGIFSVHRHCMLDCPYERTGAKDGASSSSGSRSLTRKMEGEGRLESQGMLPLLKNFSSQQRANEDMNEEFT